MLDAPSVNRVQVNIPSFPYTWGTFSTITLLFVGDSVKKSIRTCPFTAKRGLYMILCLSNLMVHLARRPKYILNPFLVFNRTCPDWMVSQTHIVVLEEVAAQNHWASRCNRGNFQVLPVYHCVPERVYSCLLSLGQALFRLVKSMHILHVLFDFFTITGLETHFEKKTALRILASTSLDTSAMIVSLRSLAMTYFFCQTGNVLG
ncbi:hypothetical protein Tco_1376304 [Tanacetum coccineum]